MGKQPVLAIAVGVVLGAVACLGGARSEAATSPAVGTSAANPVPPTDTFRCGEAVQFAHTLLRNAIGDEHAGHGNVSRQPLLRQNGFVLFDAKSRDLAFSPALPADERTATASVVLKDGRVLVVGRRCWLPVIRA